MLSKKLQAALNNQINAELGSAYLYLSMAAYCESVNLKGSAQWMRRQSREEVSHAMRLFEFVCDRDGRVTLLALAQPPKTFKSVLEVWERTLANEQDVSRRIDALCALAAAEGDFATQAMLQWFVTEQVEEEKTAKTILEEVRMIGPKSSALYFVDRHLGKAAEKKE